MANLFSPTEDERRLPGTSGADYNDLNPEQAYDTDLRRVDEEDRIYAERGMLNKKQRLGKRIKAARTAGRYRGQKAIQEFENNGEIPISARQINGTIIPGLRFPGYGDPGAGGTNYSRKPKFNFGRPFG